MTLWLSQPSLLPKDRSGLGSKEEPLMMFLLDEMGDEVGKVCSRKSFGAPQVCYPSITRVMCRHGWLQQV